MKKLLSLGLSLMITFSLFAQLRLDVAGDAKISGRLELVSDGVFNVFIGKDAGFNNVGNWNTFTGYESGISNTDGSQNTFYGFRAGPSNSEGGTNTFIGYYSGSNNDTGNGNTFVGNEAGFGNISSSLNTYIGNSAGRSSTGNANTFVGDIAGYQNGAGNSNTFLGYDSGNVDADNPFNKAIAIGYRSKVECSNCAVIGGTDENAVFVGIGTSTPFRPLDVHGEVIFRQEDRVATFQSTGNNAFFAFENNGGTSGANVGYFNDNTAPYFYIDTPGGILGELIIRDNGRVGIGTFSPAGKLDVAGDIYQNANLIHSDKRFKKAILPIRQAMEKIRQLNGVSYSFNTEAFEERGFSEGRHLGMIAQEVEQILPELVKNRPDGYKAVNYDGMIPLIIEGMKEQQEIIVDLQEKVRQRERLEDLVLQQQTEIKELKSLLEQFLGGTQEELQAGH